MYFKIGAAILFGVLIGAYSMYLLQRRNRRRELRQVSEMLENILAERKLRAVNSGEESLYAKIEHQMVRVQETIQGRRDDAETSREQLQQLITEIAHQMRSPLTNEETYLGFLEEYLKEQAAADERLSIYIAALSASTEKLHFLVESFIKMSRLEHQMISIKKEEKDVLKTVRNAIGQVQGKAEEKGLLIEATMPQKLWCLHDPNWLGEAVYNLLDNAVKYSGPGERIEVSVTETAMFVKLRVRDYGCGIDAGEENLIFRRFYRGKRVNVQEGFGIGLYLAREIVDRHGGFLTVKRMDTGLLMEMNLPAGLLEVC